ncbi:MAG: MBL fold metallo-hydrolase [Rhodospirillales bacterium 69-11]|nr:MAG: MBL fold metallo-hydrolase [Rhodospirillales bacterium 69-11]
MARSPHPALSRRGFCLCCVGAAGLAATGGWLTPRQAFAEARGLVTLIKDAAATTPITTHRVRDDLCLLEGSGGNIAVLTGPDGKALVDGGIAVSRPQLTRALAALGADPITHLINTHWHFDHTDGNAWLHAAGARIIAQENTRKHLAHIQRVEDWDYNFLPSPDGALPSAVFSRDHRLKLNGTTLDMTYLGPAHTDSDISVLFAEADVLHAGDTYWNGIYPFIDRSTGGSIGGMIAACDRVLRVASSQTVIVPGHGAPVSNKAELQAFRDMLVGVRQQVATLKRQGRSLAETVAARPTAAYDAKWGQFVIDGAFFTRLVYPDA